MFVNVVHAWQQHNFLKSTHHYIVLHKKTFRGFQILAGLDQNNRKSLHMQNVQLFGSERRNEGKKLEYTSFSANGTKFIMSGVGVF